MDIGIVKAISFNIERLFKCLERIADALEAKFVFLNFRITVCCPTCGKKYGNDFCWRRNAQDRVD